MPNQTIEVGDISCSAIVGLILAIGLGLAISSYPIVLALLKIADNCKV